MTFHPPSWVPALPFSPPDDISIADFMLDDRNGRHPLHHSRPFFTCGLSGRTYSVEQSLERTRLLTQGLAKELGWAPNEGTEWDKVIGVFSLNTVSSRCRCPVALAQRPPQCL